MSQNSLPGKIQDVLHLGNFMARGLASHGPWIGLGEITADDLSRAMQQVRDAEKKVSEARHAKGLASKRVAVADKALQAWLGKARLVVMLARGAQWSESWIHTGFTHQRTNVPKRLEARITLARALVSFFARHPEFGVAFAEVTAARGRIVYERMVQSREILEVMTDDCVASKQQHTAAESALREMMRRIVGILDETIDGSDRRRLDFGLKQQQSRPELVRGLGPAGRNALAPISVVPASFAEPRQVAAA
jgi:hypothetical protein